MINKELEKLIQQIKEFSGDGEEFFKTDKEEDEFWEKARRIETDSCEFGDWVEIFWNVESCKFSDVGYITTIPFVSEEDTPEFSGVIHIPKPQNPDGMDQPDGEWITIYDAITNPMITSIKPIK